MTINKKAGSEMAQLFCVRIDDAYIFTVVNES
jgi:hypothetical protein